MAPGVAVGVGTGVAPPPLPNPFGGVAVVKLDHATAPVGALTDGAVPHALNVVVKDATTPAPEMVDEYVIGRSVLGVMSRYPVPAG